jgi:RNA polymerase sigma-70 factor (ECF subfamily)
LARKARHFEKLRADSYILSGIERREFELEEREFSDVELAAAASSGDEGAFSEIVRRYSPRVFRFAAKFFRQREAVEDAAQEVFLKAFAQIKNYEGRGSLEGWLTRITTTTCLNLLRTAKRQPELTSADLSEEENDWLENQTISASIEKHNSAEDQIIAADLVSRVLETMSADDRLVLTLIDGEGVSIKEAAVLTGWSESKVKVQAFRARRKMREKIERLLK